MSTVKFYTLGCKVNQYETQAMREQFDQAGFRELKDSQPADFYVINTCTVTQRADVESLNFIRRVKRENSKARILVTGCLTELDEDKIKDLSRGILIVKNKGKQRILNFLNEHNRQDKLTSETNEAPPRHRQEGNGFVSSNESHRRGGFLERNTEPRFKAGRLHKGISYFKGHSRAFLKIQDGCNNFCSYCKVPLVRGVSRSRPLNEIVEEAERLIQSGYKEIVLTGICLGAFGKDLSAQVNLSCLLEGLEKIDGLERIRLSSIEMMDVTDTLINKIAESKKICRHLHIPLQSGDNEILKKMNRHYARAEYLGLIRKIKVRIPAIAITTDCLVGFPGETEVNFLNTIDLIKRILPFKIHIFPYSRREGTLAAVYSGGELNSAVIKRRILQLKELGQKCAFEFAKQFFNKSIFLLIEGHFKGLSSTWYGHTDNYIKVKIRSVKNLKNQIIKIRFTPKNWLQS
ncbi:MAG: tRNA (N(6)-L-threonylcarbamoyladenosine(37)-C(2))-methylthiotransferase MtaB [Candidatus Omnitrophota bacterium]|nr:tRNA (N(6)-L-threonylcarbamoyladenosine(37)-C(2))-methylthiotransferase MtaB [Candidatus Omnitrophota bacterium]